MKTCSTCRRSRPLHMFHRDSGKGDSRDPRCVDCKAAANRRIRQRRSVYERAAGGAAAYAALSREDRAALRRRVGFTILKTEDVVSRTADIVIPGLGDDAREETFHAERTARYAESDNKQSRDPRGYVYVLTNEFRPGWVCVGCTTDPKGRLGSYLKADPERGMLRFEAVRYVEDRRVAEREIHQLLGDRLGFPRKGEWFNADPHFAVSLLQAYIPG